MSCEKVSKCIFDLIDKQHNPNVKNDVHNKLRGMYSDSITITSTNVGVFIDSLHYDYFVYVVYTTDSFNHVCIAHYDCMGKETSFAKKQ